MEMRFLPDIFGAFEHHVLEKMGKSRKPGTLIGRAYVIPDIDGDERQTVIFQQNYVEAVLQLVCFEWKLGDALFFWHDISVGLRQRWSAPFN